MKLILLSFAFSASLLASGPDANPVEIAVAETATNTNSYEACQLSKSKAWEIANSQNKEGEVDCGTPATVKTIVCECEGGDDQALGDELVEYSCKTTITLSCFEYAWSN